MFWLVVYSNLYLRLRMLSAFTPGLVYVAIFVYRVFVKYTMAYTIATVAVMAIKVWMIHRLSARKRRTAEIIATINISKKPIAKIVAEDRVLWVEWRLRLLIYLILCGGYLVDKSASCLKLNSAQREGEEHSKNKNKKVKRVSF